MNKIFSKIKAFYSSNREIIFPTAVMVCISLVVTLALSCTNMLTYKKIDAIQKQNEKKAMSRVIKADCYESREIIVDGNTISYYEAITAEETVGYIFSLQGKGYGGALSVMTGVNADGTVAAVEILDASNETPGLGQNVTKSYFYSQYGELKSGISIVKDNAKKENNEIEAVTGATISSKAVTAVVENALEYAQVIINEQGGNS